MIECCVADKREFLGQMLALLRRSNNASRLSEICQHDWPEVILMRVMSMIVAVAAVCFSLCQSVLAQDITGFRLDVNEGRVPDYSIFICPDISKAGHGPDVGIYNLEDSDRMMVWVGTRFATANPAIKIPLNLNWVPSSGALQLMPGVIYARADAEQRAFAWADARVPLNNAAKAQLTVLDARYQRRLGNSPVFVGLAGRACARDDGFHESRWGVGVEVPTKYCCITARYLFVNGDDEFRIDYKLFSR